MHAVKSAAAAAASAVEAAAAAAAAAPEHCRLSCRAQPTSQTRESLPRAVAFAGGLQVVV